MEEFKKTSSVKKYEYKYNLRQLYFTLLILLMYRDCGSNVKYRLLSEHLFQRMQQHDGWKNTHIYEQALIKLLLPVIITWNKKYLSKQVVTITDALKKNFLQLLLLKVYESFFPKKVKKMCSIDWCE